MKKGFILLMSMMVMMSCAKKQAAESCVVDQFVDLQILRYEVPNIEQLTTQQKELLYYLTEAALCGRDILYDQNGKYNLEIRGLLENVYTHYSGDKNDAQFKALELYLKRVWVSNGIHHHYAGDKFVPEFTQEWFVAQLKRNGLEASADVLREMFDPTVDARRVVQDDGVDLIAASACNYYDGVTQAEAESFYNAMKDTTDAEPISYGLNSKLVKEDGVVKENVYKIGGLYTEAIEKIVYWLNKAKGVAENAQQQKVIEELIAFYTTGSLDMFDTYSISWVNDTASQVDFVNGFIESYGDPLGMKASWESIVNFKNVEATKRTEIISANAQWFEEHSPIDDAFRKEKVKGVTAKVINAVILAGDCYPTTPIGINLPNANWIRAAHGSKSVTLENITEAYDRAKQGNGFYEEFAWSQKEIDMMNKYGYMTDNLHTDLHECLGHGSGKLLPGVDPDALKAYGSTIEEARADLFGLYFMADDKMLELGLLPNADAYKAQYYEYFMNGLMTQQVRIELGKNIEEAHMRNRQLITRWVFEHAQEDHSVEMKERDGKTFVVINDYGKIRTHLGELLAEIQRIKSTGDYDAARALVENYAVKIDPILHKQLLDRYATLHIAPYKGFVNPVYTAVYDANGNFEDLKVDYTEGYVAQHLRYSRDYSFLTKK